MHQEPIISSVWAIHCNNDERYIDPATGYYSSKIEAEFKAEKRGWYGGNAPVTEHLAIWVNDKVYLLGNSGVPIDLNDKAKLKQKEIKATALSKLTDEEIKALGLKK